MEARLLAFGGPGVGSRHYAFPAALLAGLLWASATYAQATGPTIAGDA